MICKLCREKKNLRRSHIIPEFLYKHLELYDEKHRFKVVTTEADRKSRYKFKGFREKLLCDDCEKKIQKWEDYAAKLWFQKSNPPVKYDEGVVFPKVDYNKFKLFQLSILWRSSICTYNEFQEVSLSSGPHEERIRKMLFNEDPGEEHVYGCMITYSPEIQEKISQAIFIQGMVRIDGHRRYLFLLGGLFWHYFVSSHTERIVYKKAFLQKSGNLTLTKNDEQTTTYMLKLFENIRFKT